MWKIIFQSEESFQLAYVITFYYVNLFMFQEKRNLILKMMVYVYILNVRYSFIYTTLFHITH